MTYIRERGGCAALAENPTVVKNAKEASEALAKLQSETQTLSPEEFDKLSYSEKVVYCKGSDELNKASLLASEAEGERIRIFEEGGARAVAEAKAAAKKAVGAE